jgi:hypothetical protein
VHWDGAKTSKLCTSNFFNRRWSNSDVPLGQKKKKHFFHFKRYNLIIRAVNFCETFCTCSLTARSYNWKCKRVIFFSFGLLNLEVAVFGVLLEKKGLCLLGVKIHYMAICFFFSTFILTIRERPYKVIFQLNVVHNWSNKLPKNQRMKSHLTLMSRLLCCHS